MASLCSSSEYPYSHTEEIGISGRWEVWDTKKFKEMNTVWCLTEISRGIGGGGGV